MTIAAVLFATITLAGIGPRASDDGPHTPDLQRVVCRWNAPQMKWNDCRSLAEWKQYDARQPPFRPYPSMEVRLQNDHYNH